MLQHSRQPRNQALPEAASSRYAVRVHSNLPTAFSAAGTGDKYYEPICHSRGNHPQLARPVPHDKTARLRRLGSTAYESLMGDHISLPLCFLTHCGFVFKATRGASPPGSPSRGYTRTGYTRRVALRLLRSHENRTTAFSPLGERVAIRQPTESRVRGLSELFSKQQEAKSVRCRP